MKRHEQYVLAVVFLVLGFGLGGLVGDRIRPRTPPGVDPDSVLTAVGELSGLAGAGYVGRDLLRAVDSVPGLPAAAAFDAAVKRCQLEGDMLGPGAAAPACLRAEELAQDLGPSARLRAALEVSLNLTRDGAALKGLGVVEAAPSTSDPFVKAKVGWVRARALRALPDRRHDAVWVAQAAARDLEEAVAADPRREEFWAIAALRLAQAYEAAGRCDDALQEVRGTLPRQRGLVTQFIGYDEYPLYLGRLLAVAGHCGDQAAAAESKSIQEQLLARDPTRWEYRAGYEQ